MFLTCVQDGCWCILDEGHSLCKEAMSVLLDHVNSVLTALKTKNYFTTLADGQEVRTLDHNFRKFISDVI